MNDIPTYSMWWIVIQHDYYMQFGDRAYLARQLPYLKKLTENLSAHIGPDGKDCTPENRFLDWPTKGDPAAVDMGIQALHILAARASSRIFRALGEEALAQQAESDCTRLLQYRPEHCASKQAAALPRWQGFSMQLTQTRPF